MHHTKRTMTVVQKKNFRFKVPSRIAVTNAFAHHHLNKKRLS